MRNRIVLMISVGLVALFIFMSSSGFVQSGGRSAWEYKVVENNWDEKQFSSLGAEGWELVAVDASRGDRTRAFFKRERPK
jgi:hypothetical protein